MGSTEHGVALAPLTTMRVGGPADTLVTAETLDEVDAPVDVAALVQDIAVEAAARPRLEGRHLDIVTS